MFTNTFETLCDCCDQRYSIEWRKRIRTYYSCSDCEYKMDEIILEDEIRAGEITIDKWYKSYVEVDKPKLISDDDLYPLYDDLNTPKYIADRKSTRLNSSH